MNVTRASLDNPVAVIASIILLVIFALVALTRLSIQLLPEIERPQIIITTNWRNAAPEEMESFIIQPQEEVLRNFANVVDMVTSVRSGQGSITLTFEVGADISQAMLTAINRLNQVPSLPPDAGEPQLTAGGSTGPVASLLLVAMPGSDIEDLASYQAVIEDRITSRLRRIEGVAQVNLLSRRPKELHIVFDPYRAASLGLQISQIRSVVERANNATGGFVDIGRRQYTVRFAGQYDSANLENMILGWNNERPVFLKDLAQVEEHYAEQSRIVLRNGQPAYYITINRSPNANTVTLIEQINLAIEELNNEVLNQQNLELQLSFDASVHIRNAIAMVQGNLGIGIVLALLVLGFFLRDLRSILIIACTIPLSLLVACISLKLLGRSLNVISLAGLAFAVGMVLDAAIIVHENILRVGSKALKATPLLESRASILAGTAEVKGALFASTVTSVVIFLPILTMQGVEAQLFADLAIALSVAIIASMAVALTVIPLLSQHYFFRVGISKAFDERQPLAAYWRRLANWVIFLTDTKWRRRSIVLGVLGTAISLIVMLMPKADFLPRAPINGFIFSIQLPAGANLDFMLEEVAQRIKLRIAPFMSGERQPAVENYNFSSYSSQAGGFIFAADPSRVEELMAVARDEIFASIPDAKVFLIRGSMLNINGGVEGRSITMDLQGADMMALIRAAERAITAIDHIIPGTVVRPLPGLKLEEPELRLLPNDRRITQSGLDRRAIADAVQAMTSGLFLSEYFDGNQRMDVILRGRDWNTPEELAMMPLYTPLSGVQTINQLTELQHTVGPTALRRVNGQRTITLQITAPETMPLQSVLDSLRREVVPTLEAELGVGKVQIRGRADQLNAAIERLSNNFIIALLILFLIMMVLFKSIRDSIIVILVLPLAMAGGVLALALLNHFTAQTLDLLTMVGFIILLGLVVNNAILLVDQTRVGERLGLGRTEAVALAIRSRARPIYMSTLTSLFGMLPLMLLPGAGAEIYRGLATVIVGGMAFCATFILFLMPALLRMGDETTQA